MPSPSNVHLTVVIPAYNEEDRLPGTLSQSLRYLDAQPFESEIIVVDDGSTDGTQQVVRALATGPVAVRLIRHPDGANHGKGAAVRLGMMKAKGDYLLFMDADNSTTLEQVAGFWPHIDRGCDVVIGSRKIAGARVEVHQPRHKEIAGRLGNWAIRVLAVPGISDTQAGFKLFTRESAETIFPRQTIERWGFDIEILVIARRHGYRVCEAPIHWVNAPGSKVSFASYLQVLLELRHIRRNLESGRYE